MGYLVTNLYLQDIKGEYYKKKQLFYVLREDVNIPNILWQPFLTECKFNLNYQQNSLKISATMADDKNEDKPIYLKVISEETVLMSNISDICPGDQVASFYLKNEQSISNLGECKVQCDQLALPNLDFSGMQQNIVAKTKVIRVT